MQYESPSDFLREEFLRRMHRSPRYSQRAFARDLGLTQGFLSLVMRGRRRLSLANAKDIALRLDWPEEKVQRFQKFVEISHLRSDQVSPEIKESADFPFQKMALPDFDRVSHWYYFALVELTELKSFRADFRWLAKKLGITALEAEIAIRDLISIGLLELSRGILKKKTKNYTIPEVSSEAIRRHHRQVLGQAIAALDAQPLAEREFGSLTLAFEAQEIDAAKEMIRQFQARFTKRFGSAKANSVYQLNMSFFRQDKKNV